MHLPALLSCAWHNCLKRRNTLGEDAALWKGCMAYSLRKLNEAYSKCLLKTALGQCFSSPANDVIASYFWVGGPNPMLLQTAIRGSEHTGGLVQACKNHTLELCLLSLLLVFVVLYGGLAARLWETPGSHAYNWITPGVPPVLCIPLVEKHCSRK